MSNLFTPEAIEAASAETERLSRELDITNADHIALWLESWLEDDCSVAFLACRIIEAHEAIASRIAAEAISTAASRDRASEACASVQRERDALREMLGEAVMVSRNAAAVIGAIYQHLERVEAAGGATSISGVAACNSMLKSLRQNAARTEKLIMEPLNAFLSRYEGEVK